MAEKHVLYFVLGVLTVVSLGAVSVHDDGVGFPDGSFQTTAAALPAASAVHGQVSLEITAAPTFCTAWTTLYSVPASKRVAIQWLSAASAVFGGGGGFHPVEVEIRTHDGTSQISHLLTRLENPIGIGLSLFSRAGWAAPVTLYSEGGQPVQVRMCFDGEFVDPQTVGKVTFSGYLVDV